MSPMPTQEKQHFESTGLMKNRVVLITGASRGIGATTAKLLASQGAAVGVNYFGSEAAAQQVVDAIGRRRWQGTCSQGRCTRQ